MLLLVAQANMREKTKRLWSNPLWNGTDSANYELLVKVLQKGVSESP